MNVKSLNHLRELDRAGVLARAAFSFDDTRYPLAKPVLPNELALREQLFSEIRANLGLDCADESPSANARIEEVLDHELSLILSPTDERGVLEGMIPRGDLPADLYKINFAPDTVANSIVLNKRDHLRIIDAIKHADREEHVPGVIAPDGTESQLISLFYKFFPSKNPFNNFVGVVIALRESDFVLNVVQFIRIYEEKIFSGSGSLIDLLRRFAESYGANFLYNGKKTKFLWAVEKGLNKHHRIEVLPEVQRDSKGRRKEKMPDTHVFLAHSTSAEESKVLGFVINLGKYVGSLKLHNWEKDLPLHR